MSEGGSSNLELSFCRELFMKKFSVINFLEQKLQIDYLVVQNSFFSNIKSTVWLSMTSCEQVVLLQGFLL